MIDSAGRRRRVLLVQPDYSPRHVNFLGNLEPLALEMIAAAIEDRADVRIFDRRMESGAAYRRELHTFKPDIVGLTLHAPYEASRVIDLARLAKAYAHCRSTCRALTRCVSGRVKA